MIGREIGEGRVGGQVDWRMDRRTEGQDDMRTRGHEDMRTG